MDFSNKEHVKKLVKGCQNGNRKYQRILYEKMYGRMLGVCMRYSRDIAEAEDMVQEGFIKVFEKINGFNYKGSLEGWVRRLIINNTIDTIRRNQKMCFDYEEESRIINMKDDHYDDKEASELLKLKSEAVVGLIQKLSPAYRTVINMFIIEDMSHREISQYLGISEGTSKSNLSKAKVKLLELYKQEYKHEHVF